MTDSVEEPGLRGIRALGMTCLLVGIFTTLVLGARAVPLLSYGDMAFFADGPNTVGEAGKAYFARKVQDGEWPVADGRAPPYYPSVHGLLTHAVVGYAGRALEADTGDLYRLGRYISLGLTLFALLLLGAVGRRLGVSWPLLLWGLLLWVGTQAFLRHAVSYRPDNWLLFLGALGLWTVLAVDRPGWARLLILLLLPVVAFHVKAPGVVLGGALVLAMATRGRWRPALLVGAAQAVLVILSVFLVEMLSNGEYLGALSGGVTDAGLSVVNSVRALFPGTEPVVVFLVCSPFLFFRRTWRLARENRSLGALAAFWAFYLPTSFLAAVRSGSATYYFMEVATYGLLLSLAVVSNSGRGEVGESAEPPGTGLLWSLKEIPITGVLRGNRSNPRIGILVGLATVLAVPTALGRAREGLILDVALLRTGILGEARVSLADRINEEGLYCYSDDPGLNVLLQHPAVIYPLLQEQMMESGALPKGFMERAVREGAFDCVISSGVRWVYEGDPVLPPAFWQTVAESYPRTESYGRYEIRFPSPIQDPDWAWSVGRPPDGKLGHPTALP